MLGCHGTPACRLLFAPADEHARRLGLRLIAPDRPAYGLSDPKPGRALRDWTADTAELMDHLRLPRIAVLAVSGGAPYAAAAAAHLGDRVTALALVSPLGEVAAPSSIALTDRAQRAFFLGLPRRPRLLHRIAAAARAAFLAAPGFSYSIFAAALSPADRAVLAKPEAREIVLAMTREALRQGVDGALCDMAIYARPWDVDLASVACPAKLWQGTADYIVPAGVAFELAGRLPRCEVARLEDQGHFWIIEHVEEVMAWIAERALP